MVQDTEFPGVVARPVGSFATHTEYTYQTLRCNVDLLRIIQLGLTFADENGNIPDGCACWQFNFQFDLQYVTYSCVCRRYFSSNDNVENLFAERTCTPKIVLIY